MSMLLIRTFCNAATIASAGNVLTPIPLNRGRSSTPATPTPAARPSATDLASAQLAHEAAEHAERLAERARLDREEAIAEAQAADRARVERERQNTPATTADDNVKYLK
ncbi:hypothetical protein MY3296_009639 [Beauveria thailandica]